MKRDFTRRQVLIAVGIAAVVGAGWGLSQRVPIGPAEGTIDVEVPVAPTSLNRTARLRIGTYNIHGGVGTDGLRDLDRITEVLRGCDLVGLNEVRGDAPWRSDDQATLLARTLHMTPLYAPSERQWGFLEFGNGLLTRIAVDRWMRIPLERQYGKSYRNLLLVETKAANGASLNVVVTHIDRSDDRERRAQLQAVGEQFLALPTPAVLLGDLNSDADEPALQFVLDAPGVVDALRVKLGDKTPRHIDWVLVRGAKVLNAGLTEPGPSDHPHVWAVIELAAP